MTQSKKLQALITRAIDGGWKNEEMYSFDTRVGSGLFNPGIGEYGGHEHENVLIFNHDFAKALFGEEEEGTEFIEGVYGEQSKRRWQYHLQQAVIADNPIDYMYGVVFGGEK